MCMWPTLVSEQRCPQGFDAVHHLYTHAHNVIRVDQELGEYLPVDLVIDKPEGVSSWLGHCVHR